MATLCFVTHSGRSLKFYFDHIFRGRWVRLSRAQHWPRRSPDLRFLHFYLCGHVMGFVYQHKVGNFYNCKSQFTTMQKSEYTLYLKRFYLKTQTIRTHKFIKHIPQLNTLQCTLLTCYKYQISSEEK